MSSPTSTLASDPLSVAIDADRALWDVSVVDPALRLGLRNDAVRAAVAAGYSPDELARALQMRASDIERILTG